MKTVSIVSVSGEATGTAELPDDGRPEGAL